MTSTSARFSRRQRIDLPQDYDLVLRDNQWRSERASVRMLVRPNTLAYARLGLIVPKRWLRKAHERNRCKRLIRESFRQIAPQLPAVDIVVVIRRGIELGGVAQTMKQLFQDFLA